MVTRGDFTRDGVRHRFDELDFSNLTQERAGRCETSETQRVLTYGRSGLEADKAGGDKVTEVLCRNGPAINPHFYFYGRY